MKNKKSVAMNIFNSLKGLLVLHIFFILPTIWVLTSNVPKILKLGINTNIPLCIKIGNENNGSAKFERMISFVGSKREQISTILLPCDYDLSNACFEISPESNDSVLSRVDIISRFVVRTEYVCKKVNNLHILSRQRIGLAISGIGWLIFAVIEVALFALTILCANRLKKYEGERFLSFLIAFALASFCIIVVPLESLMANRSLYDFQISSYFKEAIPVTMLLTAFVGFGLILGQKYYGRVIHVFLLSFLFYEYLRTGMLSLSEPTLNGEVSYYLGNKIELVKDGVVISLVTASFVCIYIWLKDHLHFVVLGLIVLIAASMFDVRLDEKTSLDSRLSNINYGFCSKFDVAQSVVHSPRRNVMMFILDSVGIETMRSVLKEMPEIQQTLSGFTMFSNNIGGHAITASAVPAIMTGKLFDAGYLDVRFSEYGQSALGADSLLIPYVKENVPTYFIPGSLMFGFAWPRHDSSVADSIKQNNQSVYFCRPDTTPGFNLFEITRFRMTPFFAKYKVLLMTFVGTSSHAGIKKESELYPILAKAPIKDDFKCTLQVMHTNGAHAPFDVDRFGNKRAKVDSSYEGHIEGACFAFRELIKLMGDYKAKGLYDNSMIIITSDHGYLDRVQCKDPTRLSQRGRPILLVKPVGASNGFSESLAPTTHLKIKNLIEESLQRDMSISEIQSMLSMDSRIFRVLKPHSYKEWSVDPSGHVVYNGEH